MRPAIQYIEVLRPKSESRPQNDKKRKNAREAEDYLPLQRLKINAAFVPPKPNEFDRA